ncbi:MAG: hypothetical protein AAB383_01485 [Patescibacteria group bacterium]
MSNSLNPDRLIDALPQAFKENLKKGRQPLSIAFVCTANYNRSPALELLMKEALDEALLLPYIDVRSAGARPWDGNGGPINPYLIEEMKDESRVRAEAMRSKAMEWSPNAKELADVIFTVSFSHREILHREYDVAWRKTISLPHALQGSNTELYDPQEAVGMALRNPTPKNIEAARTDTRRMLDELGPIVNEGIIPAFCKVAGIDVGPEVETPKRLESEEAKNEYIQDYIQRFYSEN